MITNTDMANEIRVWVVSYAELAAGMKTIDSQMIYEAKMQACVQIAEGCGLLDHDDAIRLYNYGQTMTRDEISAMFKVK